MAWEPVGRAFSYIDARSQSHEDVRQIVDLTNLQLSMRTSEAEIFPRKFRDFL